MKVYDRIEKCEKELTVQELIALIAVSNRQVDFTYTTPQTDEDGFMTYDAENWTSADGKRFIRTYALNGRVLSEYNTYNKYDMRDAFAPEKAATVVLN